MLTLVTILILIIVIDLICIPFILKKNNNNNNNNDNNNQTNHNNNQINKRKLNKKVKWLKKAFNGEEEEGCQLFFINTNDVTDVKLTYELLSAKKAVEQNNIRENYNSISFDDQDKYYEYKITRNGKLKVDDTTGSNLVRYQKLIRNSLDIEELQEKFMKESNFDEKDLVSYYKAIIESKKIDEDEVKNIAKTYFTMVNQLYRLKTLSRSENVNEAISKSHITQGFDESQLKKELNELLKN